MIYKFTCKLAATEDYCVITGLYSIKLNFGAVQLTI